MTKIPPNIRKAVEYIQKKAAPESVFLYGSRARKDHKKDSDYEIGILFKKGKRLERENLAKLHSVDELNAYSFVFEDFAKHKLDTPFPRAIFVREIIETAKTVSGQRIVEKMNPPNISAIDLLESASFQSAYALAALLSNRTDDILTAKVEFTKSVFFGSRTLVILIKRIFPLTYQQIVEDALTVDLEEKFKNLIKHAMAVRQGEDMDAQQLYVNITFQNQIVKREVEKISEANAVFID